MTSRWCYHGETRSCEGRLMECSGCRDRSSSPSHPDSWEGGFCSDPTDCCNGEAASSSRGWRSNGQLITGEMQGLPNMLDVLDLLNPISKLDRKISVLRLYETQFKININIRRGSPLS